MDREHLQIENDLRSKSVIERKKAIDKLASIDSDIAVPILKRLSQEQDFGLRCMAMMGLNNHRTEESFSFLKEVLQEEQDYSVLAEAANSIYDFGERAIPLLQGLFDRCEYWIVRHTIVSVLAENDDPEVLLDIARKAIAGQEPTTQEVGILALSRLLATPLKNEALKTFTELAKDPSWRIRWRTAIALTASEDPIAKDLLTQLQQDENYRVVAAALEKQNVEPRTDGQD